MKPGRKTLTTREKRKRYVIYLSDDEKAFIRYLVRYQIISKHEIEDPLEIIKFAKAEWSKYPKQLKEKYTKAFEENRYYRTLPVLMEIARTRWVDED